MLYNISLEFFAILNIKLSNGLIAVAYVLCDILFIVKYNVDVLPHRHILDLLENEGVAVIDVPCAARRKANAEMVFHQLLHYRRGLNIHSDMRSEACL